MRNCVYGNYLGKFLVETNSDVNTEDVYFAHDHLFSPAAIMTNFGGFTVHRNEFDAYGKQTTYKADWTKLDSSFTEISFTGQRNDRLDNGKLPIMYYKNRYYDTEAGRFITQDPLEYVDGLCVYQYTVSNPIMWLDPYGTKTIANPTPSKPKVDINIENSDYDFKLNAKNLAEVERVLKELRSKADSETSAAKQAAALKKYKDINDKRDKNRCFFPIGGYCLVATTHPPLARMEKGPAASTCTMKPTDPGDIIKITEPIKVKIKGKFFSYTIEKGQKLIIKNIKLKVDFQVWYHRTAYYSCECGAHPDLDQYRGRCKKLGYIRTSYDTSMKENMTATSIFSTGKSGGEIGLDLVFVEFTKKM